MNLVQRTAGQQSLVDRFDGTQSTSQMSLADQCNHEHGRGTVVFGVAKLAAQQRTSPTIFDWLSPTYMTRETDLPVGIT